MEEFNPSTVDPANLEESSVPMILSARPIDLESLAKKIYHLIKQEMRLEQERLGRDRFRSPGL
ncbi:MAG: hypothetical protein KBG20_18695 [Caldilineaceae bacterium]|nr:hypothetical protein [Caldilineaceae bacterium]MBP8124441.1 hypothetical protein [Caldilineaceae bacterium]MBP9074343.1 hypothetical protein [Caldilineaceae bacterium]